MCLLAILYQVVDGAPLLVAANREEFFDRPFQAPTVQGAGPRYLAGTDLRAGGTWLGVNDRGLLAAVTNRPKDRMPEQPRSRGLLCGDLLGRVSAAAAADYLREELASDHYAGANFVVADAERAYLFQAGDALDERQLEPGLHVVTNGPADNPDDPRQLLTREMFAASDIHDVPSFVTAAAGVCRQGADAQGRSIIVRQPARGTVSSTLLALPAKASQAIYEFAAGPPDVTPYEDYSAVLRSLLGAK